MATTYGIYGLPAAQPQQQPKKPQASEMFTAAAPFSQAAVAQGAQPMKANDMTGAAPPSPFGRVQNMAPFGQAANPGGFEALLNGAQPARASNVAGANQAISDMLMAPSGPSKESEAARSAFIKSQDEALRQGREDASISGRLQTGQLRGDMRTLRNQALSQRADLENQLAITDANRNDQRRQAGVSSVLQMESLGEQARATGTQERLQQAALQLQARGQKLDEQKFRAADENAKRGLDLEANAQALQKTGMSLEDARFYANLASQEKISGQSLQLDREKFLAADQNAKQGLTLEANAQALQATGMQLEDARHYASLAQAKALAERGFTLEESAQALQKQGMSAEDARYYAGLASQEKVAAASLGLEKEKFQAADANAKRGLDLEANAQALEASGMNREDARFYAQLASQEKISANGLALDREKYLAADANAKKGLTLEASAQELERQGMNAEDARFYANLGQAKTLADKGFSLEASSQALQKLGMDLENSQFFARLVQEEKLQGKQLASQEKIAFAGLDLERTKFQAADANAKQGLSLEANAQELQKQGMLKEDAYKYAALAQAKGLAEKGFTLEESQQLLEKQGMKLEDARYYAGLASQEREAEKQRTFTKGESALDRELSSTQFLQKLGLEKDQFKETIRQFNTRSDFDKWAKTQDLAEEDKNRVWKAQQDDVQRKYQTGERLSTQEHEIFMEKLQEDAKLNEMQRNQVLNLQTLEQQEAHDVKMLSLKAGYDRDRSQEGYSHEESMARLEANIQQQLTAQGYSNEQALQGARLEAQRIEGERTREMEERLKMAEMASSNSIALKELGIKQQQVDITRNQVHQELINASKELGLKETEVKAALEDQRFARAVDTATILTEKWGDNPDTQAKAAEILFGGLRDVGMISEDQYKIGVLNATMSTFKDPEAAKKWAVDNGYTAEQVATVVRNLPSAVVEQGGSGMESDIEKAQSYLDGLNLPSTVDRARLQTFLDHIAAGAAGGTLADGSKAIGIPYAFTTMTAPANQDQGTGAERSFGIPPEQAYQYLVTAYGKAQVDKELRNLNAEGIFTDTDYKRLTGTDRVASTYNEPTSSGFGSVANSAIESAIRASMQKAGKTSAEINAFIASWKAGLTGGTKPVTIERALPGVVAS